MLEIIEKDHSAILNENSSSSIFNISQQLSDVQQSNVSHSYHSVSGSVYDLNLKLQQLKDNLKCCLFKDQKGKNCDSKGNTDPRFRSHRSIKNCPKYQEIKKNEKHSKPMIIDDYPCQRLDCQSLQNQINELRQQILSEQNEKIFSRVNQYELGSYKDQVMKYRECVSKLESNLTDKNNEINILKENLKIYENQSDQLRTHVLKCNESIKNHEKTIKNLTEQKDSEMANFKNLSEKNEALEKRKRELWKYIQDAEKILNYKIFVLQNKNKELQRIIQISQNNYFEKIGELKMQNKKLKRIIDVEDHNENVKKRNRSESNPHIDRDLKQGPNGGIFYNNSGGHKVYLDRMFSKYI